MSQKRQPEDVEESPAKASATEESEGMASSSSNRRSQFHNTRPESPHHFLGGSDTKRQKVPALRSVITEVMLNRNIHKLLQAIEPLIRRVVREEVGSAFENHYVRLARQNERDISPCTSRSLQLRFMAMLSLPVFTGSKIEGENFTAITIALFDSMSGEVVTSGEESFMKVELVVLEGDFEGGEENNWTAQQFNNYIVREREGKRSLLIGDVFIDLKQGTGVIGELAFSDNSSWTRSKKFRLGAKTEGGSFNGIRVREAKTESFFVKDHRGELYKKHYPPSLEDEVWRLEKIGKDGAFHKRLNGENINNVKDFLTSLNLDASRLRNILGSGMSAKMWDATVEHAKSCCIDDKVHVYHQDGPNKTGVVFNIVGELVGLIREQKFVYVHQLIETEKAEAHAAVKVAYEHWSDVITSDVSTLLNKPLESFYSTCPTVHANAYNSFSSQVDADDGLVLGQLNVPSPIFSIEVSRTLDASSLQAMESTSDQFQPEMQAVDGQASAAESQPLEKISNSLVYSECGSQSSFNDDHLHYRDSSMSFDTSDLGAALRGFIETMSKQTLTTHGKTHKGWRIVSCVLGWIFYTKKVVARKKDGK